MLDTHVATWNNQLAPNDRVTKADIMTNILVAMKVQKYIPDLAEYTQYLPYVINDGPPRTIDYVTDGMCCESLQGKSYWLTPSSRRSI